MTPALLLTAVVVATGAVVAVTERTARLAALGLLVVLVGSPFLADPLPDARLLAVRLVAGILAGYLVWAPLTGPRIVTHGSTLGWPGAAALAMVLVAAGWLASGTLVTSLLPAVDPTAGVPPVAPALLAGDPVARATFAIAWVLGAFAIAPIVLARDVPRLGTGLLLLVAAGGLLDAVLAPATDPVVELGLAAATAAIGAGAGMLLGRGARHGSLELDDRGRAEPAARIHPLDDAHPVGLRR